MKQTRRTFMSASAASLLAPGAMAQATWHMPAEDAPHLRTFMQWPVSADVYGARLLKRVQSSIADIARAISTFEEVVVLAANEHKAEASAALGGGIAIWDIPTDDLWCRDSGPTFVANGGGQLAVSQIQFNGWGGKQEHGHDAQIARRVADRLALDYLETGLVGEQGGLEHDGAGLVLAHASSWVNPNRDTAPREIIERKILTTVGGRQLIWAPGIAGADITDYHIDALARFVAPGKVLIQMPQRVVPDDPWSRAAHETLGVLRDFRTADGKALEIVTLAEPVDVRSQKNDFVASYVNFYVCNGAVICSNFGDTTADGDAAEKLQELYPGRRIVSLNTDPIGESGGGIHCSTQQQPLPGA